MIRGAGAGGASSGSSSADDGAGPEGGDGGGAGGGTAGGDAGAARATAGPSAQNDAEKDAKDARIRSGALRGSARMGGGLRRVILGGPGRGSPGRTLPRVSMPAGPRGRGASILTPATGAAAAGAHFVPSAAITSSAFTTVACLAKTFSMRTR
jgi:hypothetical protein